MKVSTMNLTTVILVAAVVLVPLASHAAFDDLAVSPRTRAMGGATIGVSGDAWSFYNNPATLAMLRDSRLATATAQPNGGGYNRLTTAGVATRLPGGTGGVAAGLRFYGVEFKDTDLLSEKTITLSHGFSVFRDASSAAAFGWSLNFYNLDFGRSVGDAGDGSNGLDPGDAWTVGLDLGGVVELHERTKVGFFTRNINNPTIGENSDELIQQMGVGLSYEPYDRVITAFDIRSRLGEEFRFHGGVEFGITAVLDLRFGIESDPSKLTGGFGVNVPMFTLDYAFSSGGGVLEATHQFGVSYRWGGEEETP